MTIVSIVPPRLNGCALPQPSAQEEWHTVREHVVGGRRDWGSDGREALESGADSPSEWAIHSDWGYGLTNLNRYQ